MSASSGVAQSKTTREKALYLKRLDLAGFKSFAAPTHLEFGPGIMAIVGPNGCGKSNIADAVRWVLGEQNARALRGTRMEDCIFSGTETHPPLNMAEVSLTLADCESVLGLEYNEVTITRRVFRSGESEYLINKTPCRLKDIQRLFMDTGIGTNSYSLMEQGRIDRVLSSRPEDRRSVFEEASGITKFKADKKEALRKLEHTEANLLRLGDLIREIRRQIISLQRQAGKARRYQALLAQVRAVELFLARRRLEQMDEHIRALELQRAGLREREEAEETSLRAAEAQLAVARSELAALETEWERRRDVSARAAAERDQALAAIASHEERIRELSAIAAREREEAVRHAEQISALKTALEEGEERLVRATATRQVAEAEWHACSSALKDVETRLEAAQHLVQQLRDEGLEREQRVSRRQGELSDLEARERTAMVRREKLAAERVELDRAVQQASARETELRQRLATAEAQVEAAVQRESELSARRVRLATELETARRRLAELRAQVSALAARIELLEGQEAEAQGFPAGARRLMGSAASGPAAGLEPLVRRMEIEPEFQTAVEAVLRPWLDGLLVQDPTAARAVLSELEREQWGAARLLPLRGSDPLPADGPGESLLAHVRCDAVLRPLLARLLGGVRVVDTVADIPAEVPSGIVIVTKTGAVFRGEHASEFWMRAPGDPSLLERKRLLGEWGAAHEKLDGESVEIERLIEALRGQIAVCEEDLKAARTATAAARRDLALGEGEHRAMQESLRRLKERAETVALEIETMSSDGESTEARRSALLQEVAAEREEIETLRRRQAEALQQLKTLEQERGRALSIATEARLKWSDARSTVERMMQERQAMVRRLGELEDLRRRREAAAEEHLTRVADLEAAAQSLRDRLGALEAAVNQSEEDLADLRRRREERSAAINGMEQAVRERRAALESLRRDRGALEVELAEVTTRRQGLLERVGADHRVTPEDIARAGEPPWEELGGAPADREALEALAAELRARLEALGAVNLIAIEEYENLEKRYAFLTQQQDDLLKAREQLLDLIRRINQTTTAMFRETFEKVNENFRVMFEKLFGGGTAKLVLVDEEDVLECGIEIIARPPGKKLQSVSLLSGGERTMTAVALLFALYMVKPSPFCLLDELDAALDDSNIGRFVKVVREFLDRSQFIIITHNRQTIAAADRLFGVTMESRGVSKIVSIRFNQQGRLMTEEREPAPATPT